MAGFALDSGSRNRDWRYEPGVQRTYEEFAQDNGTIILLARPTRVRDKAQVESRRATRGALDRGPSSARDLLLARGAKHPHHCLFGALNTRPMPLYRAGRRELLE